MNKNTRSISMSVEIHGTKYTKADIVALSYTEAYQMLGACEDIKSYEFVCASWNSGHRDNYKKLGD